MNKAKIAPNNIETIANTVSSTPGVFLVQRIVKNTPMKSPSDLKIVSIQTGILY